MKVSHWVDMLKSCPFTLLNSLGVVINAVVFLYLQDPFLLQAFNTTVTVQNPVLGNSLIFNFLNKKNKIMYNDFGEENIVLHIICFVKI